MGRSLISAFVAASFLVGSLGNGPCPAGRCCCAVEEPACEAACCGNTPELGSAHGSCRSTGSEETLAPEPAPSLELTCLSVVAFLVGAVSSDPLMVPHDAPFVPRPSTTVLLI